MIPRPRIFAHKVNKEVPGSFLTTKLTYLTVQHWEELQFQIPGGSSQCWLIGKHKFAANVLPLAAKNQLPFSGIRHQKLYCIQCVAPAGASKDVLFPYLPGFFYDVWWSSNTYCCLL